MANEVVWFEVIGKNGDALRSFYGELFDWKINLDPKMNYGMVDHGGDKGIAGGVGQGDNKHVTFYVETDDIAAKLEQVKGLGGKVLMERTELPGGTTIGMFADVEGNAIGLVEPTAA